MTRTLDLSGYYRVFLILASMLAVGGCWPERAFDAWSLLSEIEEASGVGTPMPDPKAIQRQIISFKVDGIGYAADVYRTEVARATLVLVPGATRSGKDDRRLIAMARALAKAKFSVVVPEITAMSAFRLSAADAKPIAAVIRHQAAENKSPVLLGAVSYAVGPTIVAALDKEVLANVAGLVAIGGYYDIESAIGFLTTGCQRSSSGKWDCRPANPVRWAFAQANAQYLTAARDRFLLLHAAERKLAEPEFGLGEISAAMTAEGKALLALLEGHDPSRVSEYISALPPLLRESIAELDLKRRDLAPLRGKPWLIVHGIHDPVIPAAQSEALAQAVGGDIILIGNLAHATLNTGGMSDAFKLWRGIMRLLEMRDQLAKGGAS